MTHNEAFAAFLAAQGQPPSAAPTAPTAPTAPPAPVPASPTANPYGAMGSAQPARQYLKMAPGNYHLRLYEASQFAARWLPL
jgi:hypothetical protein